MNNKGFAITGILYGLMILFILVLSSFLSILIGRNNRTNKIVEGIYESVEIPEETVNISDFTVGNITYYETNKRALYSFVNINNNNCVLYLPSDIVVAVHPDTGKLIYKQGGGEDIEEYIKMDEYCNK